MKRNHSQANENDPPHAREVFQWVQYAFRTHFSARHPWNKVQAALKKHFNKKNKALTLKSLLGGSEAIVPLTNDIDATHRFTHNA
jgi:hypothetical protein